MIRVDLLISFILAIMISLGVGKVASPILPAIEQKIIGQETGEQVKEGEVGGLPRKDTKEVTSAKEILESDGKTFTITLEHDSITNQPVMEGEKYKWHIINLNDMIFFVRVNMSNVVVEGEEEETHLPVGIVVEESSEVEEEFLSTIDGTFYEDLEYARGVYLDMDGEANTTYRNTMYKVIKIIPWKFISFICVMALTFFIHFIGVKIDIFPKIFEKKEKSPWEESDDMD